MKRTGLGFAFSQLSRYGRTPHRGHFSVPRGSYLGGLWAGESAPRGTIEGGCRGWPRRAAFWGLSDTEE